MINSNNSLTAQIDQIINLSAGKAGPIAIPQLKLQDFLKSINGLSLKSIKAVGFWAEKNIFKLKIDQLYDHTQIYEFVVVGDEAKRLIIFTHEEAFKERMSFLTNSERVAIVDEMVSAVDESIVTVFKINNNVVGLIVTETLPINKVPMMLISWVWIAREIEFDIAQSIRERMKSLFARSTYSEIVARVDLKNKRSLDFFNNLNFEVKWIFLK